MNRTTVITCINNDTNKVEGFLCKSPSYMDSIYYVTKNFNDRVVIGEYNNDIHFSVEELIDHIFDEDILDKTTFNPYTQHFELRDIDCVPHTENQVKLTRYYLNKLKDLADHYRNPFVNDAGGSRDYEELYRVIDKQLEYFNTVYK